ncbi:MAG: hypothetical protein LR011_13400 [Verrucomicrobia bacterium]|nr:hypothetical protein [Verrucomicrobiota bacterium]
MAHETFWEERGIYWKFSGDVSYEEIAAINQEFYDDGRSDKMRYQITDFSDAEIGDISEKQLLIFAALDFGASHSLPQMKQAIVANSQKATALAQRYIELSIQLKSPWKFRIFSNIGAARAWVDDKL